MKTITLKTISRPVIICHFSDGKAKKVYYMTEIDDKLERLIDDKHENSIKLDINGKNVNVSKTDINFYGEMNFETGGDDYETIQNCENLFCGNSSQIPAKYNYEKHTCIADENSMIFWETFRPELIVQYFHGLLGKPKKCIIFRRTIW